MLASRPVSNSMTRMFACRTLLKYLAASPLLGSALKSPIVIAPVGSQNAFHAEGEIAMAHAAKTRDTLQILSSVSTRSIKEIPDIVSQ